MLWAQPATRLNFVLLRARYFAVAQSLQLRSQEKNQVEVRLRGEKKRSERRESKFVPRPWLF